MIAPPDNSVLDPADEEKIFRRNHPWDVYFDGKARRLFLTEHFPNVKSLVVMIDIIWQAARRRGIKISVIRDTKRQCVCLKALKTRANNAGQGMEEVREKTGKPVRHSKTGVKRGRSQKG